jgi:hypothetical protein
MLEAATRAANLLVEVFGDAGPEATPGHQEIEIALIKLYRVTGQKDYLDLAEAFIERRGRIPRFAAHIFQQNRRADQRTAQAEAQRAAYRADHPGQATVLPETNAAPKPRGIEARFMLSALRGQYFQQHRPVRQQTVPVGHAVRFAYLETATAMLARARGDESLRPALEAAWSHMVERRMHVSGGIGSLPVIEGFGRDYELDPEVAYAETCAALGCLFWNWEMSLLSGQAAYADLFEWQLYNAAAVGMGLDGRRYLYNNPLACRGGVTRRAWYEVPCCPSNLSRTWAHLGRYLYSTGPGALWVHQYVGSRARLAPDLDAEVEVTSALPEQGRVTLRLAPATPAPFTVHLRIPSWAGPGQIAVNGQPVTAEPPNRGPVPQTASGVAPQAAWYLPLARTWSAGDRIEMVWSLPVVARRAHPQVRALRGRVALTRGPVVYCLESVDNPGLDLFEVQVEPATFQPAFDAELLGGVWVLRGQTGQGRPCTAIPYQAWANRGPSQMAVWVRG